MAVVVLACAAGVNLRWQQQTGAYFSWGFSPPRSGPFPLEAGQVFEEDRAGWRMRTTALPDGSRACGSGTDGPTVVFVGDSYVYGSGIPDDGTLCWQVRERLAADGLPVHAVNLGQPGASLDSNADTLALALERYRPDLVVVSVLPGDDARPFDLNRQHAAARHPAFRALAGIFEAEPLWLSLSLAYEVAPADFWDEVAIAHGTERLRALLAERGVAVVFELLGTNQRWQLPFYEQQLDALVAAAPDRRRAPFLLLREDAVPADGTPVVIPGDGHPTPHGNGLRADGIAPLVRELLAARGT